MYHSLVIPFTYRRASLLPPSLWQLWIKLPGCHTSIVQALLPVNLKPAVTHIVSNYTLTTPLDNAFSILNIGVKNSWKQNNRFPLAFFKFLIQFSSMIWKLSNVFHMIYCIFFPIQEQELKDNIIIISQQNPPSFFIPSLTDSTHPTCFAHWNASLIILVAVIT